MDNRKNRVSLQINNVIYKKPVEMKIKNSIKTLKSDKSNDFIRKWMQADVNSQ